MKKELFDELMASMGEALEHAQGKRELRTTILPPPPEPMSGSEVKQVRKNLKASQAVFARYLNVSTKLVQAWESSTRRPTGPALLLSRLTKNNPSVVVTRGRAATHSTKKAGAVR